MRRFRVFVVAFFSGGDGDSTAFFFCIIRETRHKIHHYSCAMETADTGEFDDAVVMQGCEDDVGYAVDDRVEYAVDDSVGNKVNDSVGDGVVDSESLNLYETFDAACKQTISNAYDPRFLVGGFDDRPYGQAATAWVAPFNMETNGPLWKAQVLFLHARQLHQPTLLHPHPGALALRVREHHRRAGRDHPTADGHVHAHQAGRVPDHAHARHQAALCHDEKPTHVAAGTRG